MIRLAPLALLMLIIPLGVVQAQEPATDITVHSPYTSVAISSGKSSEFDLDLKISNTGDETAIVDIEILSGPDSWNTHVYSKFKIVKFGEFSCVLARDTRPCVPFLVPEDVTDGNYPSWWGFSTRKTVSLTNSTTKLAWAIPMHNELDQRWGKSSNWSPLHRPCRVQGQFISVPR